MKKISTLTRSAEALEPDRSSSGRTLAWRLRRPMLSNGTHATTPLSETASRENRPALPLRFSNIRLSSKFHSFEARGRYSLYLKIPNLSSSVSRFLGLQGAKVSQSKPFPALSWLLWANSPDWNPRRSRAIDPRRSKRSDTRLFSLIVFTLPDYGGTGSQEKAQQCNRVGRFEKFREREATSAASPARPNRSTSDSEAFGSHRSIVRSILRLEAVIASAFSCCMHYCG